VITSWAKRAEALYDEPYARRYRRHDDEFDASEPSQRFAEWLAAISSRLTPPIDVLDLGCGTGRYFWAVVGVRELVGLDASASMLVEARRPYRAAQIAAQTVTLVHDDLFAHDFPERRFDLVYSIGVLAEHVPLDATVVGRVARWLKVGGRFAFTTVHPESPSIPRTAGRTLGRLALPFTIGPIRRSIHARLQSSGMYADECRIRELLAGAFEIESLDRGESEAHLHCLCVARKSSR
jgi:SAM-dependent methyltransferase